MEYGQGQMGRQWYVFNLRYLKAERLVPALESAGFEFFVPPKVTNIVFIHSCREIIDDFLTFTIYGQRMHYMYSRMDMSPIVIRQSEMEMFIRVCTVCEMPIVMTEKPNVKLGDKVRVKDGPFAGLEGNVVRMRKSKRVLIGVGGVIWAATTYIPPEFLEIVE
ncbi:MAG: hypothetical protein ACI39U_02625 [Candidatus Cryptobacteroides sp.]